MRLLLALITFLSSIPFVADAQKECTFTIISDTAICEPGMVKLWIQSPDLEKINWFGPNIEPSDTLSEIYVQVDSTAKFYVTNRITEGDNLIVNGDFESGNVNFTSDYWSSCYNGSMPQGSYCVNNQTNNYWPAWANCSDHTKTGLGNMFVTDGAIVPDEKVWCQTVNTDPFSDYALSAYLTPVLDLNNAELQFTINSKNIGDVFKAKNTECEWNEFFEVWNSGTETSAEICITNQNTASNGNDFALDDISFKKVCYTTDSVTVSVIEEIEFEINEDTIICPGDTFTIQPNKVFDLSQYNYLWSTGASTHSIKTDQIGDYKLTITHNSGCGSTDSMAVTQLSNPTSYLPSDTTVCLSISNGLLLNPGEAKWTVWEFENEKDTRSTLLATTPGLYNATLYNGKNCFSNERVFIEDFCSTDLFIPNAFTPNGDGHNDTFGPKSAETYDYELRIYNRMGRLIFQSFNLNNRWDGENAPQGTYAYWIKYDLASKTTGALKTYTKTGIVHLIR